MKFLIINSFHRDDKGDAALVHVLVDQLLTIDRNADVVISSMEDPRIFPAFYKARNVGSFELRSSSRLYPFPLHLFAKAYILLVLLLVGTAPKQFEWMLTKELRKIYDEYRTADLITSVGGGYFLTKKHLGSRMHLIFAIQIMKLAKRLGRKVVTAPVSVGSFQNVFEANYASKTLRNLDLLLLREDISKKYFVDKDGNLPPNVRREPDSAFAFSLKGSFDLRAIAKAKTSDRVVTFAVRNWLSPKEQNTYNQAHADLIDHIAEKYPKMRPVFIPQCTFPHDDDDDRKVGNDILALSKTKKAVVITDDPDYKDVKLSYRETDFVVGTRFHSMVFALSYEVPGIAIEYEHKTRGIMRDLGLEEWTIPFGEVTSEGLIALFDRMIKEEDAYKAKLAKVMPPYIASANKVAELFSNVLGK